MSNFEVTIRQPGVTNPSTGEVVSYVLYSVGSGDNNFLLNGTLKLEVNKAGTFEFDILPFHSYYSVLRRYIQYVCVREDDDILFYGRILSMNLSFNGTKHVTCEGLLANLLDCPMFNPAAETIDKIFTIGGSPYAMFECGIRAYRNRIRDDIYIGYIRNDANDVVLEDVDTSSGTSVGDFIQSELVEAYGGFMRMEYREPTIGGPILGQLNWDDEPELESDLTSYKTATISQTVSFGENMLDFSGEPGDDDIYTGIIPTWEDSNNETHWVATRKNDVTMQEETPILMPYIVGAQSGLGAVGIKVVKMPGTSNQEKALQRATNYANKYCSNYILSSGINVDFDSFTVRALDIHFLDSPSTERIGLYDRVRISHESLSIDRILMCSSIEILIDNPLNSSYTFSIYRPKASSNDKVLTRQIKRKRF